MKLHILTIVLDGLPFLAHQLATFNRLRLDWQWHIVEGTAMPVKDTAWCRPVAPRLSLDGTTNFLNDLKTHPRVVVHQRPRWEGKTEMCNTALAGMKEPGALFQVDVDELWTAPQVEFIYDLMTVYDSATFFCRYFVGKNIVTVGENCYGNNPGEWLRAWKFIPGMFFLTHEPPRLSGISDRSRNISREETRNMGLVFDHYAYAFATQVAFKEQYYGYTNALSQWKRLQTNTDWPVRLKYFLPWVDDRAQAQAL